MLNNLVSLPIYTAIEKSPSASNTAFDSIENHSLASSVRQSLRKYFSQLEGDHPANLYELVLSEIEKPLLEMTLELTNANQSQAAIVLGISRGTLRKKMAMYALFTKH